MPILTYLDKTKKLRIFGAFCIDDISIIIYSEYPTVHVPILRE